MERNLAQQLIHPKLGVFAIGIFNKDLRKKNRKVDYSQMCNFASDFLFQLAPPSKYCFECMDVLCENNELLLTCGHKICYICAFAAKDIESFNCSRCMNKQNELEILLNVKNHFETFLLIYFRGCGKGLSAMFVD